MADSGALTHPLADGWSLIAAGIGRDRDKRLVADVVLHNGVPVYTADRLALASAEAQAAFGRDATAAGRPDAETIVRALLALVPQALAQVQGAEPKPTQAEHLLRHADDLELWHTPEGKSYATLEVDGHREHWPLGSRHVRDWLSFRFYEEQGKAPGGQALQDALSVLAGRARFAGAEHPVAIRLAEHAGAIYLDLADDAWRAVEIDATGWRVVDRPPVRFRRTRGMQPLPAPMAGGAVADLYPFLNVPDERRRVLVVAWLLAALRPRGPYPILPLHGEQGSAKSTTARVLRALVDPSTVPLRSEPRDERDLAVAAGNAWLLAYDNLSRLPDWLSDALCRISTGGGFGTRQLYSDDEETLFDFMRPVLLNGIEELATRPDLLERSTPCELPTIPEDRRRDEAAFWRDFEARRPAILGALLTVVRTALARLPHTTLARKPRMADFALWMTAAEDALGWPSGTFLAAYDENRRDLNDLALDTSPVAQAARNLAQRQPAGTPWSGTASDLLTALGQHADEAIVKGREWPKSARALSGVLRRYAPNLRAAGVLVRFTHDTSKQHRRIVEIEQHARTPSEPSEPSDEGPIPRLGYETASDANTSPSDGRTRTATALDSCAARPSDDSANAGAASDGSDGSDGGLRLFPDDEYATPPGWVTCPACMKPFDGAGEATYCPACLREDE